MRVRGPRHSRMGGFTYMGLIILVAVLGLVGAATLKAHTLLQRAAAEKELLEIGAEFQEAFRSYAVATPRGQINLPRSLDDLLLDQRKPTVVRHLRKIYVDPVTGQKKWGEVKGNGFLLGVHSLSERRPLKRKNFDMRFRDMDNRDKLSDWRFGSAMRLRPNGGQGQPGTGPGTAPGEGAGNGFGAGNGSGSGFGSGNDMGGGMGGSTGTDEQGQPQDTLPVVGSETQ